MIRLSELLKHHDIDSLDNMDYDRIDWAYRTLDRLAAELRGR